MWTTANFFNGNTNKNKSTEIAEVKDVNHNKRTLLKTYTYLADKIGSPHCF